MVLGLYIRARSFYKSMGDNWSGGMVSDIVPADVLDGLCDELERLRGIIEAQRVDLGLLIGAVRAGDPNDELRVRVEDMQRHLLSEAPEGGDG